jgi:two-component sensor histidine kinase
MVVIGGAFVFGQRAGFAAVGLTTLLAFFFFEPFGTLAISHAGDLVKIQLYAFLAGFSALIVASIGQALVDAEASGPTDGNGNVFVREMTHRIGNNFAVVAALIRRKAGSVTDAHARSVLDEAIEQVTIMARLHRHLQVRGEVVSVDSEEFLAELCNDLQALMVRGRPISVERVCTRCALPIAQAVRLGLIVNELVTNALKHAFPDSRRGTVSVRLNKETGDCLRLVVEDDGVGVRDLPSQGSGKGRSLTQALAAQLGGRLECRSENAGTSFSLLIPLGAHSPAPRSASRVGSRRGPGFE